MPTAAEQRRFGPGMMGFEADVYDLLERQHGRGTIYFDTAFKNLHFVGRSTAERKYGIGEADWEDYWARVEEGLAI